MGIYLDNAATTAPFPEVIDEVKRLLDSNIYGNPNSVNYEFGLQSRRIIENARMKIAEFINADSEEIYFLSSASAANNLAIQGYMNKNINCHNYVVSNIEHSSLLDIDFSREYVWKHIIECDNNGYFKSEQFMNYRNCLISIMAANNEIGTLEPIKEIAKVVHKNNNVFHSDLTAYIPYYKVNIKELGCDMATFSMHKLHGIKGCGILYVKKGIELAPLVYGSQENGLFGGTENIYSIAAAGKAVELYDYNFLKELKNKRDYLIDKLLNIDGVYLNGSKENRSINNVNVRITKIELDNMQLSAMLDLIGGYQVATGSSCHSGDKKPSHVLKAIGLSDKDSNSSIRITLDEDTSYEELDKFIDDLNKIIEQHATAFS